MSMYGYLFRRLLGTIPVMLVVAVFIFLGLLLKKTTWTPALERSTDWSITTLGHYLLTKYSLIFELISLLLLVAMLGAIVTARGGRRSKAQ